MTGIAIPHPVFVPAVVPAVVPEIVPEFVPVFVPVVHMFAAMDMDRNGIGRRSPARHLGAHSVLPMRRPPLGRVASGGLA